MVLNEAVEVPSWMSTSFGQDLGCSLSYVDRLMVPPNRNKKLKKVGSVWFCFGSVFGSPLNTSKAHEDGLRFGSVLVLGWFCLVLFLVPPKQKQSSRAHKMGW